MKMTYRDLALAFRVAVLIVSMAAGAVALIACARAAQAATLKSVVELSGTVLKVGDLFEGLDADKASKVLGPAPQPGQDMVLNVVTLMRVAAAFDIPWKPHSTADQITVSSASTLVDDSTIRDAVTQKLQEKGVNGAFTISLTSTPKLVLPPDAPATAEIASMTFHPDSDRFEATVAGPSAAAPKSTVEISGHVERSVSVPVLKKAVRSGETIGADLIEWIDMPVRSVQPDILIEADTLVGKTPRRMVMASRPVHANELVEPQLISRGESVTIMYEKGPITVTAKGKAMENGSRGEPIRVVNIASNRTIDATVSDSGLVTVTE